MQQRQLWRKEAVGQRKSFKTRGTVSSNAIPSFGFNTTAENHWSARSSSLRSSVVVSKSRPPSGPHISRPAQCAPRARSSLGFSRGTTTTSGAYEDSKPIGFDIARYIKLRGSATNVRIGINGDPSATGYFRNYVRECQARVKQDEDLDWDLESESDTDAEDETFSLVQVHPVHVQKPVPLCWEDQVQNTEPRSLKTPRENERTRVEKTSTKEHDCTPPKLASPCVQSSEKLKHMTKHLSVMLSNGDRCITGWRDLQQLRAANWRTHNVHIPSQYAAMESDDSLDHFLAEDDGEDKQKASSLPTETNHKQLRTELLPKLSHTSPEQIIATSSLCIWLEVPHLGLQEEPLVSRLEFDVFVTAVSPGQIQPSTKAFTKRKAKRISDTVYVLLLDLPWRAMPPPPSSHTWAHSVLSTSTDTRSHAIRVSLVCCDPRVILFCMEAKIESLALCSDIQAMEGSGHISQRFFHKRSNYCDQEDDEDMTDMRAVAKEFPDLRVLDFDGSSLENTPFSPSPIHQSPQSPRAHRTLIDSERQLQRSRVHPRPFSATTSSSYMDIVRQWLRPYLDH